MIKLIVFDLDGVLIDSKDMHYYTLNESLRFHSPEHIISREDHLSIFDGMSTYKKLNYLMHNRGLPIEKLHWIHKTKQKLTAEAVDKIKPDPTKREIFEELNRRGYRLAVASNSISSTLIQFIDRLNIFSALYGPKLYSNEDVKRPKPAAEIYMRACLDHGVDPTETLVVEDSPIGRQAAISAGCHLLPVENSTSWGLETVLCAIERANGKRILSWSDDKMNVVIPMAGAGSRFEKAGYTFPKPLIEVRGKPMIQVVTENLGIKANFIFIVQKSHSEKYNLPTMLNLIAPGCKIVTVDGITEGAACTVLKASEHINNQNPLLIANSDQFLEWDPTDFFYTASNAQLDGLMVTFKATHPKWSFAEVKDAYITRVAEKNPISDNATAGVYYWRRGEDFVKYAHTMMLHRDRTNNEYYVAPVHNWAIGSGLKFRPYQIDRMWGIGTPEDLNYFLENYKGQI